MKIPRAPSEFTVGWFNQALQPHLGQARVTGARLSAHALPGQTAEIFWADLDYEGVVDLPSRMVVKATSTDPQIIDLVTTFGQYGRDAAFYNQPRDLGIPVPACYRASIRPTSRSYSSSRMSAMRMSTAWTPISSGLRPTI